MGQIKPKWAVAYKEVKNLIHNDMSITKEDMHDIFREIAREEVAVAVGQNGEFIVQAMKDIVRDEMIVAIQAEGYPVVSRNIHHYSQQERNPFHKYVSQIMKEEIIETMRQQFEVGVEIKPKSPTPEKEA